MKPNGFRLICLLATGAALLSGGQSASAARRDVTPATIVFQSDRDGRHLYALHSISTDGTGLAELPASLNGDSWTANGGRLAIVTDRGDTSDVTILGADGRRRTFENVGGSAHVVWSPGGRKLAIVGRQQEEYRLNVVDVDSGDAVELGPGRLAHWSPDGKRIAFLRPATPSSTRLSLWTVRSNGLGAHMITDGFSRDDFSWSPDGQRLAYVLSVGLWVVRADGSRATVLWFWGIPGIDAVSWSPDGKRLLFQSGGRTGESGQYRVGLFVVGRDGRGKHRVFEDVAGLRTVWAPRGRDIAVVVSANGGAKLFAIHADGEGRRLLLAQPSIGTPLWSPDGTRLAVPAGDWSDVWLIDVPRHDARRLTEGSRYGYSNKPVRWLPAGLPGAVLPRTPVTAAIPSDSVISGDTLKSTRPVNDLAADGAEVAIHYGSVPYRYDQPHDGRCLEAWNVATGEVTRFSTYTCDRTHSCCGLGAGGFVDLTLAGGRLAWSGFYHFAGLDIFDLYTASTDQPAPVLVSDVCPDNRYGDCLIPEADLEGDGPMLVFDTWKPSCPYPSYPLPCSTAPKPSSRLLRLDVNRSTVLASSPISLTPLSVDAGRILVDRQNGALDVLDQDGSLSAHFHYDPDSFRSAKLQGTDLVLLRQGGISGYDVETEEALYDYPVSCSDAAFADLQDGVAVYICGARVHVLRLSAGRDVVLTPVGTGPHAQLEASGLFYSYNVDDEDYPGRVRFISFAQLFR